MRAIDIKKTQGIANRSIWLCKKENGNVIYAKTKNGLILDTSDSSWIGRELGSLLKEVSSSGGRSQCLETKIID